MKKISQFIIVLSLIFSLAYAQINEFVLTEDGSKGTLYSKAPEKSVVKIVSWVEDLQFSASMEIISMDPRPQEGVYYLVVNPQMKQKIKIRKKNFKELVVPVRSLAVKELIQYTVSEKVNQMVDGKGDFSFETLPTGADISIDGFPSFGEQTPYLFENYSARGYKVLILKDRYKPVEVVVNIVKDKKLTKIVELEENWANVSFSSPVKNASLILNGKEYLLPVDFKGVKEGLVPGRYNYEITAKGYKSKKAFLNLDAGEFRKINEDLELVFGRVKVDVSPVGAGVWLDGKYIGKSPLQIDNVAKSKREFLFKKEHYSDKSVEVEIREYNNKISNLNLELVSGDLEVLGLKGSKIYVNDKFKGSLPLSIPLALGSYNLRIEHEKSEPCEQSISLKNIKSQIRCSQELLASEISVSSEPSGATVFLDGKRLGVTPIDNAKIDGSFDSRVLSYELEGYDNGEKRIRVDPNGILHEKIVLTNTKFRENEARDIELERHANLPSTRRAILRRGETHQIFSTKYITTSKLKNYMGLEWNFGGMSGISLGEEGFHPYPMVRFTPGVYFAVDRPLEVLKFDLFETQVGLRFFSEAQFFEFRVYGGFDFSLYRNMIPSNEHFKFTAITDETDKYLVYSTSNTLLDILGATTDFNFHFSKNYSLKFSLGWSGGALWEPEGGVLFKGNENINSLSIEEKEKLESSIEPFEFYYYRWFSISIDRYFL